MMNKINNKDLSLWLVKNKCWLHWDGMFKNSKLKLLPSTLSTIKDMIWNCRFTMFLDLKKLRKILALKVVEDIEGSKMKSQKQKIKKRKSLLQMMKKREFNHQ